jgi:multiple sugar transport system substrate-binding protein
MKPGLRYAALAATLALAAGCMGGGTSAQNSVNVTSISHTPVTLTFWSAYTGREKKDYDTAIAAFEKKYPWITVNHVGNQGDSAIINAINGGNPPDAVLSFGPDSIGKFCQTGAYINLNSLLAQSHVDVHKIFPPVALTYTSYKGDQCALPALTDVYGLYYNKSLLAKAGITSPPKTMDELLTDAEKTTQRNPDGSIKVLGLPVIDGYNVTSINDFAFLFGAHWFDASGHADLASDPAWTKAFMWQKKLIDFYGYDNATKWDATYQNSAFTPQNAFENGKAAMEYDGEWRVAFVHDDGSTVNYGTAPAPTADPSLYGAGHIGGDIVGIPRGAAHPAQAWLLIKFLATDTAAEVHLSNLLRNLPVTNASLTSPDITPDPNFQTFFPIFSNPKSQFIPTITAVGPAYANLITAFDEKWEKGDVSPAQLHSALVSLDTQIDQQIAQASQ